MKPTGQTALSLAGTAIHDTYVGGTTLDTGAMARVLFYAVLVGKAATGISPVKLKVQACEGDPTVEANWIDVASLDESDEGYLPLVEHSYTVGSGATVKALISAKGCFKQMRIAAVAAAAGAAGDSITVTARPAGL